ncbi:MAG: hypothetical protein AB1847_13745, partial [bacterium]
QAHSPMLVPVCALIREIYSHQQHSLLGVVQNLLYNYKSISISSIESENEPIEGGDCDQEEIVMTADIIQEWMEESMEKGRKEGIELDIRESLQQGLQQGIQEGLLEAISIGLELKFGAEGMKLYERISLTSSGKKLRDIKNAVRAAKDIQEIESLL